MVGARWGPWTLFPNHQGRPANGNREGETEEARMVREGRDISARIMDKNRRPAFSGIIVDAGGAGWLDGDDVESAKWRRHLVAIHTCEVSENGPKFSKNFPLVKMNDLRGSNYRETFAKKVLKRLAKQTAMAVILEFDPSSPLGNWVSLAKCYANQPAVSIVLAVHNGKTIFKLQQLRGFPFDLSSREVDTTTRNAKTSGEDREFIAVDDSVHDRDAITNSNVNDLKNKKALLGSISVICRQLPESNLGWPLQRRSPHGGQEVLRKGARNVSVVQWVMGLPNRSSAEIPKDKDDMALKRPEISFKSEFEVIEETSPLMIQSFEDKAGDKYTKDSAPVTEVKRKAKMALSVSFIVKELQQETPGWPLRPVAQLTDSLQESDETGIQGMESEMSLSNQITDINLECQIGWVSNNSKELVERTNFNHSNNVLAEGIAPKKLELNQSVCKLFSYAELKVATSNFSTENLIGEGGCSTVYRGCLPNSNSVVVKALKPYKEARDDFLLEINIVSSIKHKHITPLTGVCMENEHLFSVYDYFPEGSLEEILHGHSGRCNFQWEMRFKGAVAVAEALNYLHNECSPPVIHRDVKSSNILLSEQFQPQLSDFGLAMWGSTDSSYVINTDVVGTFGYIAPEYLMHGRVSDKIDVYAFGILLLELLSGRRPINFDVAEGQRSLVLWAKEVLNNENSKALMDPKLDMDFNDAEVQRMVMAATLCIDPSARLRPNMSQILKLLKGEKDVDDFINFHGTMELTNHNHDVDDIFPKLASKPSLSFALRDIDNDFTTPNTAAKQPPRRLKLKDYLKLQQE